MKSFTEDPADWMVVIMGNPSGHVQVNKVNVPKLVSTAIDRIMESIGDRTIEGVARVRQP